MRVRVYSTISCGYCKATKTWLSENNIEFEEIMLDNQQAIGQFKEDCPGATMVPQIIIDGVLHKNGYQGLMENAEKIKEMLT